MIDRLEPTRRPQEPVWGYQNWRQLLFLHWQVPLEALRPLVPEALSLDVYEGAAYVGVVPFVMRDIRPRWLPAAAAFNFLETNVRTYVHLNGRPGVYFFSLDASSRLAVWAARYGWGLPYHHARMTIEEAAGEMRYDSVRSTGPRHTAAYRVGESLGPSDPESLEFFLLERYLLFVSRRERVYVGQVHHTPYPAQQVELLEVHDELIRAAGLEQPAVHPCFAHYASGVDVEIFALKPV